MPWIQLLFHRRIRDVTGRAILHYPGDLVFVKNKAEAQKIVKTGSAMFVDDVTDPLPEGCGLMAAHKLLRWPPWVAALRLDVTVREPWTSIPYSLTVFWDGIKATPRGHLVGVTLGVLQRTAFDLAVPFWSYEKLANYHKPTAEATATKRVIHDLRVPTYETRLMFWKRNDTTEALMKQWAREREGRSNVALAFMRAVYKVKPRLLPLPVTWMHR